MCVENGFSLVFGDDDKPRNGSDGVNGKWL